MSHIVTIKTQVRDLAALAAACARLGLAPPVAGSAKLFVTEASGHLVRLPGWRFPVVIQPESAQLQFDNYKGAWGKQSELDRLLQAYAVEKARIEARRAGHSVSEQTLADGSIRLTLSAGGAA